MASFCSAQDQEGGPDILGAVRILLELDYAEIAISLSGLTRKSAPNTVSWPDECQVPLLQLKVLLYSEPVLKSPDFTKEFVVQTKACERGVGAVLGQVGILGEEHPVVHYSRKLLLREKHYLTVDESL